MFHRDTLKPIIPSITRVLRTVVFASTLEVDLTSGQVQERTRSGLTVTSWGLWDSTSILKHGGSTEEDHDVGNTSNPVHCLLQGDGQQGHLQGEGVCACVFVCVYETKPICSCSHSLCKYHKHCMNKVALYICVCACVCSRVAFARFAAEQLTLKL